MFYKFCTPSRTIRFAFYSCAGVALVRTDRARRRCMLLSIICDSHWPAFLNKGPFASTIAIQEFKKQFRAKSGVAWEERKGMVARKGGCFILAVGLLLLLMFASGKYTWLGRHFNAIGMLDTGWFQRVTERDFSGEDEEKEEKPSSSENTEEKGKEPAVVAECSLSMPLQVSRLRKPRKSCPWRLYLRNFANSFSTPGRKSSQVHSMLHCWYFCLSAWLTLRCHLWTMMRTNYR